MTNDQPEGGIQILLADDDEVNQRIVRAFLAGTAMELTIARDGREALEVVLQRRFDLMIFDQNMPFITGDRVIRHLRAGQSVNADTPVIRFITEATSRPATLGPDGQALEVTVAKPLGKDVLISVIEAMLGRR
ncbi:response regulator [bacterium]|nr:response regulator [bacterium]